MRIAIINKKRIAASEWQKGQNRHQNQGGRKANSAGFSSRDACTVLQAEPSSTVMTSTTSLPIKRSRASFFLNPAHAHTLRANFAGTLRHHCILTLSMGVLAVFAKLGTPALVGQIVYGLALTTPSLLLPAYSSARFRLRIRIIVTGSASTSG